VVSTGLLVDSMLAEENWGAIEHTNGEEEDDEEDKKDEENMPGEDEDWVDEEEEEEEEDWEDEGVRRRRHLRPSAHPKPGEHTWWYLMLKGSVYQTRFVS
jgi:hypothetical protein